MATPYALPPQQLPDPNKLPDWIVLGMALLVVGGVGNILYRVSPMAGYGWVALVLIGYAATGGREGKVLSFLKIAGVTT